MLGEAPSLASTLYKWYHIRLRGGNTEGWVYAGDDDTWIELPSRSRIGIVKTEETRLNIRRGAGSQYKVIGKAEKGEKLIILGKEGDWYQVQLNDGTKGYAHKDFIVIQE